MRVQVDSVAWDGSSRRLPLARLAAHFLVLNSLAFDAEIGACLEVGCSEFDIEKVAPNGNITSDIFLL